MATTGVSGVFIDTNVLVASNVATHPLRKAALAAISTHRRAGVNLWISRQVLREYLATLSRPQTYTTPLPPQTLVQQVRYFRTRFYVAEDTAQVTARLLALIRQIPIGGKQVHDANIVATMLANNVTHLLTHNTADFTRYQPLITVIPL